MKNVELVVPKRVVSKIMKDFLRAVAKSYGMNPDRVCLSQGSEFCAVIYDEPYTILDFRYNLTQLLERGDDYENGLGVVCANMGQREKYAKGFSQITRVLLHEFGHHMTYYEIMKLYGAKEMARLYSEAKTNKAYVHVPCEWVATKWGLDWLRDAEHRKIAREFERKFWACFE